MRGACDGSAGVLHFRLKPEATQAIDSHRRLIQALQFLF
jgi:hypothetical protein